MAGLSRSKRSIRAALKFRRRRKINDHALTFFIKPWIWSFHVVGLLQRTTKFITHMQNQCFANCCFVTFSLTSSPSLLKVTVYLQGWLQLNGYSASQLHHRYSKPYIKLKLIELGIQIFHCFPKKINFQGFRKVGTWRSRSSFKSSNSMRFLYFGSLFFFSRSGS